MNYIILCASLMLLSLGVRSQPAVEIEGAITIGNSSNFTPTAGSIRWSGTDFEGFDGTSWVSLTGKPVIGTVVDVDGNEYSTVEVGGDMWMAENLRVQRFNNGDIISRVPDPAIWVSLIGPGYASYNNDAFLDEDYGLLYNGFTVIDSRNICPIGWHIPSSVELSTLLDELGGPAVAGGFLKEFGNEFWLEPNIGGHNSSGMCLRGAGLRDSNNLAEFSGFREASVVWSSTRNGDDEIPVIALTRATSVVPELPGNLRNGFSVRCVQD